MTREDALRAFLKATFTAPELRMWLESGSPDLVAVADAVPDRGIGINELVHQTLGAMGRQGVVDEALFLSLVTARPRRAAEIRDIAKQWGVTLSEAALRAALPPVNGAAPLPATRAEQVAALEDLILQRERHLRVGQIPAELSTRIDALVGAIMAAGRPKAGDSLAGARLLKPVGNGNFGTIWLAEGPDGAELAVKVFHLEKLAEGVMLWRFRRSIHAMRQLAKDRRAPPNVARLHEVEPDTLAFSMPYFKGGNLEDIARRGWTTAFKLERFVEICRAVEFAHQIGIIHRDIKPANVVMDAEGRPVLTDFDISDIKFATKLSTAGGLGTPIFAAPEQLEQGDLADERSDIYSLGRLLHFLLLERSPGYQDERDPSLANLSAFPAALVAIVRRASQWDPKRRYHDVASLIRDVEQCQSGLAAMRAHARRATRWVWRNAALLVIAGLVSGGSFGAYLLQKQAADREAALSAQLGDALAQIKALSGRADQIAARGTEVATQLMGLKHERELLAAQRDAPGATEAQREALSEEIAEKDKTIADLEAQQQKDAAELAALKDQIKAAQDKADRAQSSRGQPVVATPEVEQALPSAPAPSPQPAASGCTLTPSGGPTGQTRKALEGTDSPMSFVGLSAGRYCMGSPDGVGRDGEHPQHEVRVSGFYLAKSEVTQAQWKAVVTAAQKAGDSEASGLKSKPSNFKGDDLPVEQVSWCDAARYANALSRLEDLTPAYTVGADCESRGDVAWDHNATGFRLPTEAQWEFAARAGTSTAYTAGDAETDLARQGWYDGNSGRKTHAVCTAAVKPWGLCDLAGNVWEWNWDWYGAYQNAEVGNPAGPTRGVVRVLRGGSWLYGAGNARSADRSNWLPSDAIADVGFRLVLPGAASEP